MKEQSRNAWKRHNAIDTVLSVGVIGFTVAGLLVTVLMGPDLEAERSIATHATPSVIGARG